MQSLLIASRISIAAYIDTNYTALLLSVNGVFADTFHGASGSNRMSLDVASHFTSSAKYGH